MKAVEILKKARALIADPKHWIKGTFKLTKGHEQSCYCALGAVREIGSPALSDNDDYVTYNKAQRLLRDGAARVIKKASSDVVIVKFNDASNRTHDQVLKAFDIAIAKAEKADV